AWTGRQRRRGAESVPPSRAHEQPRGERPVERETREAGRLTAARFAALERAALLQAGEDGGAGEHRQPTDQLRVLLVDLRRLVDGGAAARGDAIAQAPRIGGKRIGAAQSIVGLGGRASREESHGSLRWSGERLRVRLRRAGF